ncbi:MAG: flagellar export chaperone FliS [bacterium]|nr:flagellar export chaperone FliS [bacterium]
MSPINPYLKQYKKNQVETATPEQILILLYDGAINFLNKAKLNLEANDDESFHHNMQCCKNIIAEFMDTLDMEQGGQFAAVLYNLYKYLRRLIITSDVSKNTVGIDEVLKHLTNLRNTWSQAIEKLKTEQVAATGSANINIERQSQKEEIVYSDGSEDDEEEIDEEA